VANATPLILDANAIADLALKASEGAIHIGDVVAIEGHEGHGGIVVGVYGDHPARQLIVFRTTAGIFDARHFHETWLLARRIDLLHKTKGGRR
jgi:hypothetical protein